MNTEQPPVSLRGHPCFDAAARQHSARVHLPVAPRCNIQCNFCNRKFDCVNESRPGVASAVLTPRQAVAWLAEVIKRRPETAVAGIAGPGDPFANPAETLETLCLVRERFPELLLCVATNGLAIGPHIDELARLKVSHVTVTVCAVDPEIGAEIYAWARDGRQPLRGEAAAALLIERQFDAIGRLSERGILVKVNSILVPGVNDAHIPVIADAVASLGAGIMNVMPMVRVGGSAFEDIEPPDAMTVARVRLQSGLKLPQMSHCARCRADAAGIIGEEPSAELATLMQHYAHTSLHPEETEARPYVAVASMEGVLVNQHLGEADRFLVYEPRPGVEGAYQLKEIRMAPPAGGGADRWTELAGQLKDCRALLAAAAGPMPMGVLTQAGVKVVEMEGFIEEGLRAVYGNRAVPAPMKRRFSGCSRGSDCQGTGTGCG